MSEVCLALSNLYRVLLVRLIWSAIRRLASCGGDRAVFSWDVGTGRIIRKFRGHNGVANSASHDAGTAFPAY